MKIASLNEANAVRPSTVVSCRGPLCPQFPMDTTDKRRTRVYCRLRDHADTGRAVQVAPRGGSNPATTWRSSTGPGPGVPGFS